MDGWTDGRTDGQAKLSIVVVKSRGMTKCVDHETEAALPTALGLIQNVWIK